MITVTIDRLNKALRSTGMTASRLSAIGTTAIRMAGARATAMVTQALSFAVKQQREINRSFLPQIQEKMHEGYTRAQLAPVGLKPQTHICSSAERRRRCFEYSSEKIYYGEIIKCLFGVCWRVLVRVLVYVSRNFYAYRTLCDYFDFHFVGAQGGEGRFNRIKHAVQTHAGKAMTSMFAQTTKHALKQIEALVKQIQRSVNKQDYDSTSLKQYYEHIKLDSPWTCQDAFPWVHCGPRRSHADVCDLLATKGVADPSGT